MNKDLNKNQISRTVVNEEFFRKYDVPAPRYTSYPTVPYWNDSPTTEEWVGSLKTAFSDDQSTWSMYIHIPYCETLCTFCGCNTVITRNHDREEPYVNMILKELDLYLDKVPEMRTRPLRQVHLGGGTPTFLSAKELRRLMEGIFEKVTKDSEHFEAALEVDPRRTTKEQLEVLYELGFRRISLGVQDFNPEVQRLVNRVQPFDMTRESTNEARTIGYTSVNFDLIYGLPKQSLDVFKDTIYKTIELRPDRIALYSFALVPWIKPQQRLFKDEDLPMGSEKRALYEWAYQELIKAGYLEIGMDHFALPEEALSQAMKTGHLHRNFMGYTDVRTDVLLGLGVSAISETPNCFHQNEKVLPLYEQKLTKGEITTLRGHKLSVSDQQHREQILKFMTTGHVHLKDQSQKKDVEIFLQELIKDELVVLNDLDLEITDQGKPFLRNACMALDERLRSHKPETRIFSGSV